MIDILSEKLARKLFEYNTNSDTSLEVYKYGLDLIISSIFNISILLIIASVWGVQKEIILYTMCFAALRVTSGGYHAPNHFKCLLYYAICMFGVIGAISLIDKETILVSLNQLNILISIFLVFAFSPVASRNKPLSKSERTSFRRKSGIITLIISSILISQILFSRVSTRYSMICSSALLVQALTLIPILNREEDINEKN